MRASAPGRAAGGHEQPKKRASVPGCSHLEAMLDLKCAHPSPGNMNSRKCAHPGADSRIWRP
eukprot:10505937-Karenia_brevis.AAC.1